MLDIENKKVLANINSIKFPEKALGSKISRLNNRINKIAGLKDFILYKNNSVSINPDYYHLFE